MSLRDVKQTFMPGTLISLGLHIFFAVVAIVALEANDAKAIKKPQVYTVTLEGGKKLGGVSQVPKKSKKKSAKKKSSKNKKKKVAKKKIKKPSLVEKRKKAELAKKKKAAEKKKKEEQRKKAAEKKKRDLAEKRKAEEARKVAEKKAQREKRERLLEEARQKALEQSQSESANSTGDGVGAARLGGKGFGGGVLRSREFIAYRNALEKHIKSGWHWVRRNKRLQVQVVMRILPEGALNGIELIGSSGNTAFDDSVLRAVYKASPVPAPPESVYEHFRHIRITFDSHE